MLFHQGSRGDSYALDMFWDALLDHYCHQAYEELWTSLGVGSLWYAWWKEGWCFIINPPQLIAFLAFYMPSPEPSGHISLLDLSLYQLGLCGITLPVSWIGVVGAMFPFPIQYFGVLRLIFFAALILILVLPLVVPSRWIVLVLIWRQIIFSGVSGIWRKICSFWATEVSMFLDICCICLSSEATRPWGSVEVAPMFLSLGRFVGGGRGTIGGISWWVLLDLGLAIIDLYLELWDCSHRWRQTVDVVFCLG